MAARSFFNQGRRAAISGWAMSLSVVFISSGLVGEAFKLLMALKISVIIAGLLFAVLGTIVAPDKDATEEE